MKLQSLLYAATMLVALPIAASAAPGDVTGTVDVQGHVTGACAVITGNGTSSTFTGNIDLGELANPNGKLNTTLTGGPVSFTVVCNTTTPSISLSATSLVGVTPPPDATYTNVVGYTAHLGVVETVGSESFSAVSANGVPTATTSPLAHALSGSANNISVSVDTLTSNGATLTNGAYGTPGGSGGIIAITISPT
jgi:hypothetical protein